MDIFVLNEQYKDEFYSLAKEYLPDSNYEKVVSREKDYRNSYLMAIENGRLVGVCFGWERKLEDSSDKSFCLQGIAIKADQQKKGFGTKLLKAFCDAAKFFNCNVVSVGSAGGYVERFYINNGFVPVCYKAYGESGIYVEKSFKGTFDYESYSRKNEDGFVVMEKELL